MKTINHICPTRFAYKALVGMRPVSDGTGATTSDTNVGTIWLMVEDFGAKHLLKELILP